GDGGGWGGAWRWWRLARCRPRRRTACAIIDCRQQRRIRTQQPEIVAIAVGGVERQAVPSNELSELRGRHHRAGKQAHQIALAERRRPPPLPPPPPPPHREQPAEPGAPGPGPPQLSKRRRTE